MAVPVLTMIPGPRTGTQDMLRRARFGNWTPPLMELTLHPPGAGQEHLAGLVEEQAHHVIGEATPQLGGADEVVDLFQPAGFAG